MRTVVQSNYTYESWDKIEFYRDCQLFATKSNNSLNFPFKYLGNYAWSSYRWKWYVSELIFESEKRDVAKMQKYYDKIKWKYGY